MTPYLFVYGTLMRVADGWPLGRDMRRRLSACGAWIGPASMRGRLYDRGRYPLLVAHAGPGETAHGEIVRLRSPHTVFDWLDPYESVPRHRRRGREYARVVSRAWLADGRELNVWVYAHTGSGAGLRRMASGRWLTAARGG